MITRRGVLSAITALAMVKVLNAHAEQPGYRLYNSSNFPYTIQYPEDWGAISLPYNKKTGQPPVDIFVPRYTSAGTGIRIQIDAPQLASKSAHDEHIDLPIWGNEVNSRVYVRNGKSWTISLIGNPPGAKKYLPVFERIVKSFSPHP